MEKPLFVPLNADHYDNFASGLKEFELRCGPQRWNLKTVYAGRPVTISRGYGKSKRINGEVGAVFQNGSLLGLLSQKYEGVEIWQKIMPHALTLKEAHLKSSQIYGEYGDFIAFEFLESEE